MSIRNQLQLSIYKVINPLVKLLIRAGLTPNMVTTIGLLLNIGVSIIFIAGAEEGKRGDLSYVGWAGALILFAGLFDMLDGQVARLGNMSSRFGALYDSVLDRYSELILFLGICYYLVAHHYFFSSLFAFIGMIGSLMVSYTRARAEGLGIECKDGLMQRPERVILIAVSALACGITGHFIGGNYKIHWPGSNFPIFETISIFTIPLTVMAVLANGTAIGRLIDAKKSLEDQAAAKEAARAAAQETAQAAAQEAPANTQVASANMQAGPAKNPVSTPGASILLLCLLLSAITTLPAGAQAARPPVATTAHPSATHPPVRDAQDTFPIPPHNSKSLFYLQRTPNTNTIICELNEKNGIPDEDDPVHVLWVRYTEQKQRQELSFLQRHFAYGIKSQSLGNDRYVLHFISYKKLPLVLKKSPVDNQHHVYATISGKEAILSRIYIKINPGGSFWSPNVEYIELKGTDPDNGKELMQRIKT
jgi:phosphatidylglycerophosphate synthase